MKKPKHWKHILGDKIGRDPWTGEPSVCHDEKGRYVGWGYWDLQSTEKEKRDSREAIRADREREKRWEERRKRGPPY